MKTKILERIDIGIIIFLILGLFFTFFSYSKADMDYMTGLYTCTDIGGEPTQLTGYVDRSRSWSVECPQTIRIEDVARENDVIIECNPTMTESCGNQYQYEEERNIGFIFEFIYQKGTLPDDYILQISFLITITIISFMGTLYLMKKMI